MGLHEPPGLEQIRTRLKSRRPVLGVHACGVLKGTRGKADWV